MDFTDRIVWITGASSGIGEALARELAARGARLVLSARRAETLEAVRLRCDRPDAHLVLPLDLTDTDAPPAAVARVVAHLGRLDVLVHNGGISQRSLAQDTDLAVDRRIMEVNYFGAVALTKAALPALKAQGGGRIVVVSSLTGKFSTPLRSAYAASKHALHGFFDALRAEVAADGVGVTLVCPGYIRTNISVHALRADGSEHGRMDTNQLHGLSPEACARRMADAVAKERDEVIIAGKEGAAVYLKRFAPGLLRRLLPRMAP